MGSDIKVIEPQQGDPLQRMRVYRIACELLPEAFNDAKVLAADEVTQKVLAIIPRERDRTIRPGNTKGPH